MFPSEVRLEFLKVNYDDMRRRIGRHQEVDDLVAISTSNVSCLQIIRDAAVFTSSDSSFVFLGDLLHKVAQARANVALELWVGSSEIGHCFLLFYDALCHIFLKIMGDVAPGCMKKRYKFNSTQRPSSKRPMPKTPLFALATRQVQQIPTRSQRQHAAFGINAQLGAGVGDVQVAHGQLADAV